MPRIMTPLCQTRLWGERMKIVLISAKAQCVDGETEFFTGSEWKKIKDYQEGDKVLQFDNGKTSLVTPLDYIHQPCEGMYHIHNTHLDMCCTPDHQLLYFLHKYGASRYYKKTAQEIYDIYHKNSRGFSGIIPSSFSPFGKGINLSDNQIRLRIAIYADGTFVSNRYLNCAFNLKREKKIHRLKELLEANTIEYKCYDCKNGFKKFYFHFPEEDKHFPSVWYQANLSQMQVINSEVCFWDGYNGREYFSTSKKDADFVQFVFASCGYKATINAEDRRGVAQKSSNGKEYIRKSIVYTVLRNTFPNAGYSLLSRHIQLKEKLFSFDSSIKESYCFTVPSGAFISRRKDTIAVTGNCGKDTSASFIAAELKKQGQRVLTIHYADFLKWFCREYLGWDGKKETWQVTNETGRSMLQRVGTDVVRKNSPNTWVEIMISLLKGMYTEYDVVLIPDVRFPNEIENVVKAFQGESEVLTVRVERPDFDNGLTPEEKTHISETALDDYCFDLYVKNVGDLERLRDTCKGVAKYIMRK